MAQINVTNLTFAYEGSYDNIFEDVSFQIDTDWKLGFIGRNGKGKTTFLNLLLGKYEYSGSIQTSTFFDYFPYQIAEEEKEKDTIEVIERIQPDYELWMVLREMDLLRVNAEVLYRPFRTLSNGEQTKVMLALLFARENYFLLIDEPTNHLDGEARNIVRDYLKKKKSFLLVSHDRTLLNSCVDHVLVLNRNSIEVEKGNFSSWYENKQRKDQFEKSENEKLKKEIGKLKESARKTATWADKAEANKIGYNQDKVDNILVGSRAYFGEKSRKMQQRRQNLERRQQKAMEEKQELLKNIEEPVDLKLMPLVHHKDVLVRAKEFGMSYGDKKLFSGLDFEIRRGDRLVIRGYNGSGKTSIIKAIMAKEPIDYSIQGEFETASGLVISYINQDTSHLSGSLDHYIESLALDESLFKAVLRQLDFDRVQFEKRMEEYSQGQKKKVLITASLLKPAHLYIWDEPLNYIDVFSRMQIENLILKYQPTMLLVEHDDTFVKKVATKEILLTKDES